VLLQQKSGTKPSFDKTLFKKDLQNEEEGLYKHACTSIIQFLYIIKFEGIF
jgi:hypothetical protein